MASLYLCGVSFQSFRPEVINCSWWNFMTHWHTAEEILYQTAVTIEDKTCKNYQNKNFSVTNNIHNPIPLGTSRQCRYPPWPKYMSAGKTGVCSLEQDWSENWSVAKAPELCARQIQTDGFLRKRGPSSQRVCWRGRHLSGSSRHAHWHFESSSDAKSLFVWHELDIFPTKMNPHPTELNHFMFRTTQNSVWLFSHPIAPHHLCHWLVWDTVLSFTFCNWNQIKLKVKKDNMSFMHKKSVLTKQIIQLHPYFTEGGSVSCLPSPTCQHQRISAKKELVSVSSNWSNTIFSFQKAEHIKHCVVCCISGFFRWLWGGCTTLPQSCKRFWSSHRNLVPSEAQKGQVGEFCEWSWFYHSYFVAEKKQGAQVGHFSEWFILYHKKSVGLRDSSFCLFRQAKDPGCVAEICSHQDSWMSSCEVLWKIHSLFAECCCCRVEELALPTRAIQLSSKMLSTDEATSAELRKAEAAHRTRSSRRL